MHPGRGIADEAERTCPGISIFYMLAASACSALAAWLPCHNPVHSAIFLVLCFFNVAGIFVMLGAEFLAVIQVIVYTGAILVLLLFVLMLVDPDDLPEFHTGRPIQRSSACCSGAILLLEIWRGDHRPHDSRAAGNRDSRERSQRRRQYAGARPHALFRLSPPVRVASLVLTVGVIGAIVLALPERLGAQIVRRRGTISLGHARGVDLTRCRPERRSSDIPIRSRSRKSRRRRRIRPAS